MEENSLHERLDQWYNFLREQDKEKAIELKDEITPLMTEATDPALQNTYDLLHIRFYLLMNDLDRAKESLQKLEPFQEQENDRLNYLYYFFQGMYLYDKGYYRDSLDSYLKAETCLGQSCDELEYAEFDYKIAATYYRLKYITLSISYASEALRIFKDKYDYKRSAHCENLLGINNTFISQYEEAEVHHHNALIYTEKFNDEQVKNMVYHNLGDLYSFQNLSKAAINYLNKANHFMKPEEYNRRIKNIFLLSREHFKLNHGTEGWKWLEDGLNLCLKYNVDEYIYHFKMLKAKYIPEASSFADSYQEGIDFFDKNGMWEYVIEYGEELGNFYREKGLYQGASSYYYLAIRAKNKIKGEVALV